MLFDDEDGAGKLVLANLCHGANHRVIDQFHGQRFANPDDHKSLMRYLGELTRICKIQVASHEHGLRGLGKVEDYAIGLCSQANFGNMRGDVPSRNERCRRRSRKVGVNEESHDLTKVPTVS